MRIRHNQPLRALCGAGYAGSALCLCAMPVPVCDGHWEQRRDRQTRRGLRRSLPRFHSAVCLHWLTPGVAACRSAAELALTTWEKDAAPGFIASLVQIVQQTEAAPQPARLLAAIVAKNAVGSSWRKTMGTKEWSRVPEDEKVFIRSAVEGMLLSDPSDQIALQLTLLIANMAQFDFPSGWPHLLSALVGAADWEQPASSPAAKIRAMRTVKQVVAILAAKRPSINTVEQAAAGPRLQTLVAERVEELKQ